MKLIAQKPCSFGGKKFYIGEEIPVEYVLEPKAQAQMGTIVIVDDESSAVTARVEEHPTEPVSAMTLVIRSKNGDMSLNLTAESLQTVVDALTGTAPDAETIIEKMTDGDALILLHAADQRRAVKAAAEARAKALNDAQESEGDQ